MFTAYAAKKLQGLVGIITYDNGVFVNAKTNRYY